MADAKTSWRGRLLVGLALSVVLAACWWVLRDDDSLKVPLGVEQAAIITYGGPGLVVKPFRYGVAVTVRMSRRGRGSAGHAVTIGALRSS